MCQEVRDSQGPRAPVPHCAVATAHVLFGSRLAVVAKITFYFQMNPSAKKSIKSYAKLITTKATKMQSKKSTPHSPCHVSCDMATPLHPQQTCSPACF